MGYTHYWEIKKQKRTAVTDEQNYQKAIRDIHKMVLFAKENACNLAGVTAHTKVGSYGGINFNGVKSHGHETFYLTQHFKDNEDFNFCKTAQKPYDVVVVAALIILKYHLKDRVRVTSDGENIDWQAGLKLAKHVCKYRGLKIPKTIRDNSKLRCIDCGSTNIQLNK